jgi:hypothetical protein
VRLWSRLCSSASYRYNQSVIKARPRRFDIFYMYEPVFLSRSARATMPGFLIYNSFTLSFAHTQRAQAYNMAVGRYVIMPDHIHLFVTGGP